MVFMCGRLENNETVSLRYGLIIFECSLTRAIKIIIDIISHLLKLVSNQMMDAIPILGMIIPPGNLNILSLLSFFFNLSLMVAKITMR